MRNALRSVARWWHNADDMCPRCGDEIGAFYLSYFLYCGACQHAEEDAIRADRQQWENEMREPKRLPTRAA